MMQVGTQEFNFPSVRFSIRSVVRLSGNNLHLFAFLCSMIAERVPRHTL